VDVLGVLEQRAAYHDGEGACSGGWVDGHDAIAERMIAALEISDVFMVIDSPGGAAAGLEVSVNRVLEAKERFGRRVTVYADEMIGSSALWWAAVVGDEIYGPPSMVVGSIGARGGHMSYAGQLQQDGLEPTFFSWPPGGGKVAFAPELPLSPLGLSRGERDVTLAGEAFARVIEQHRGIPFDQIIALNADVLPGQLAVDAGLADGVASFDDVLGYALALVTDGDTMNPIRSNTRTEDPKTPEQARTEGETPKPGEARAAHEEPDGDEPPTPDKHECKNCGMANESDAKFCDQCGVGIGKTGEEAEEPEDPDDPKEPEGKPAKPGAAAPPAPSARATQRSTSLSMAAILGLREGASEVAKKTAVLAYVNLGRAVMTATEQDTPDGARGAFRALVDDSTEVHQLRSHLAAVTKRENYRERMSLLHRLNNAKLAGYTRGDLFVDREVNGKLLTAPAPMYAEMKLDTLRGLVTGKTSGNAPRSDASRNPFTASEENAKKAKLETHTEAMHGTKMLKRAEQISSASADQLARTAAALDDAGLLN
jgi:ClpP class serine protease